jgi:Na+-driven multidrug efflux pump
MGIEGLAIANLLNETIAFFVVLFLLIKFLEIDIKTFFSLPQKDDLSIFGNVSLGICIESLVKNVAYFFLIIGFINSLGSKEIGGYYLSMHLYWNFYLVPVLAIIEMSRALLARSSEKQTMQNILRVNLYGVGAVLLIWCILFPFTEKLFALFSTDKDVILFANQSFIWLFIPYILMSINMVIDSLFYSTGKTKYLAYQSLWTNILVYLNAYILYYFNIWQPTFISVLILFGIGILVDSFFTILYVNKVMKQT